MPNFVEIEVIFVDGRIHRRTFETGFILGRLCRQVDLIKTETGHPV